MLINKNIEINYSSKLINYEESINLMEKRVNEINTGKERELIWFLNHNHIYTMGASGTIDEIRGKLDAPLIRTNRGGKITYHGPGQRIIYFVINLNNRKKDIRKFVNLIENSAINVLKEFDIEAKTFPERVGIWVIKNKKNYLEKEQKIGSIGLRVKKWIVYHGLSFNINPSLGYYKKIDACGLKGYTFTSMQSLGINIDNNEFDKMYLKYFLEDLDKL